MTPTPPSAEFLASARAETIARTRRQVDQCILLAVVTSTDVAAALIDQAVELRAAVARAGAAA